MFEGDFQEGYLIKIENDILVSGYKESIREGLLTVGLLVDKFGYKKGDVLNLFEFVPLRFWHKYARRLEPRLSEFYNGTLNDLNPADKEEYDYYVQIARGHLQKEFPQILDEWDINEDTWDIGTGKKRLKSDKVEKPLKYKTAGSSYYDLNIIENAFKRAMNKDP